ncbi:hypothetical protein [Serratia liquefaciens]|jgi:hypothetical protein|uniref:hypothetical protein n=1 Tax=Serratia liquefaciens TaxID=614 RepID=UPI0021C88313|nr:hypothetical protein [Serratia liquefaciens]
MKPVTHKILGITVFPPVAMLQQVCRWWTVRGLRQQWSEYQIMRQMAREHGSDVAFEVLTFEWSYRVVKAMAGILSVEEEK